MDEKKPAGGRAGKESENPSETDGFPVSDFVGSQLLHYSIFF